MTNQASRSQNNLENCSIIWLDVTINLENDSTQASVNDLRDTADFVLTFNKLDECVDYITDVKGEQIFLILSGTLAIDILPLIYQAQQLQAVYIFSSKTDKYKQWAKQYLKVHGVYSDIPSICRQLKQNIIQLSNDLISIKLMTFNLDSSGPVLRFWNGIGPRINLDDNKLTASFMYSQMLRDILLQMDDYPTAKQEMIEFCRESYRGNCCVLRIVDEFDSNYRSDLAIWWYTRPCFLSEVLNCALRHQNTPILYKFRFFVKDLHEQIENLHLSTINRPNVDTLYRYQAMEKKEFLRLQENSLLSFSNFLSTTTDKEVAKMYAPGGQDRVGVLFEIEADGNCSTCHTPFACIKDQSYIQVENEVLFSMGSVFRIKSIDKMENEENRYRVQLIITDADDKELDQLKEQIENEIGDRNGVFCLASLTRYIGKYDEALQFYQLLLNDSSLSVNDPIRLSIIYNDIGCIYQEQKDYTKALEFYQKSLSIKEIHSPANDKNIAIVCSNIGITYCQQHMLDEALIYFEREDKIDTNREQNDPESDGQRLADKKNNMGIVYVEKGDYFKALSYFQSAKQIENEILFPCHPNHAQTYYSIACCHFELSEYDEALFYFQKALEIQKRSLPEHPRLIELLYHIAKTYENIGDMHINQERHEEAIKLYNESLAIRLNSLKEDEEPIAILYKNIGLSLCSLGKLKESLGNMEKAMQILLKTLAPDDSQLKEIVKLTEIVREKVKTQTQLQEK